MRYRQAFKRPFPIRRNVPSSFQTLTILAPAFWEHLSRASRPRPRASPEPSACGRAARRSAWPVRRVTGATPPLRRWGAGKRLRGADFVVVCTPVESHCALAREVSPVLCEGAIITDVRKHEEPVFAGKPSHLGGRCYLCRSPSHGGLPKNRAMEHASPTFFLKGALAIVHAPPLATARAGWIAWCGCGRIWGCA